ncbi:MAG: helix-turn-helix domain-containing protein [Erythrobacter sp.]
MGGDQSEVEESCANYKVRSRFFQPPPEFDGCFTTFYQMALEVDDGGTVEDYLQPEWGNIRFFAKGTPNASISGSKSSGARFTATGPSSRPCHFELGTARMWGIGFLPLGWARFVDAEARSLKNTVCDGSTHSAFSKFTPLCDVLCDDRMRDADQFDAIVEFMRGMMRPSRDETKIMRVHKALVDTTLSSVSDLAESSQLTVRTLERVCTRYFGFSPKLLMRRQRFMRSLSVWMLQDGKLWTEAMDDHYHDQAQFTREFAEFMTMNPSQYAHLDHPILSSFMEARARMWGSAAQTLDKPTH